MYSYVTSGTVFGIEGMLIQVETDVSDGLPALHLVGSLSGGIRESGERIRTAMRNSGFRLPPKRIVVNLSPADVRKDGSGYDLPIAVAILISMGFLSQEQVRETVFLGELCLDGTVMPVRGVLSVADHAKKSGFHTLVVAYDNRQEASLVSGLQVIGIRSLTELVTLLQEPDRLRSYVGADRVEHAAESMPEEHAPHDFRDLHGQPILRRAMEIAASGMHNLLMSGPPGAGKTLAAKCLTGILPPLSFEECMELTKIYSVRGMLPDGHRMITARPFRSPHHSASMAALIGGGLAPKPGEISLAHNGVLFLDELPEFSRTVIDALRQPLEDGSVTLSRLQATYRFPARIMLVGAMNPCPCGAYPDRNRCHCTLHQIQTYQNHVSRALLDRMDLHVTVRPPSFRDIKQNTVWEASDAIRERVVQSHRIQTLRYRNRGIRYNAQLPVDGIREFCQLGSDGEDFMQELYEQEAFSARGYHRVLKLARTIADMEASERISFSHLKEAVSYRLLDRRKESEG